MKNKNGIQQQFGNIAGFRLNLKVFDYLCSTVLNQSKGLFSPLHRQAGGTLVAILIENHVKPFTKKIVQSIKFINYEKS